MDLGEPKGSEPGGAYHVVVVQSARMNRSQIDTVVVCVLTSNLRRGKVPGNVTLSQTECGLPKSSVVNISQMLTVDKADLSYKTGEVDRSRMDDVLRNINRVLLRGRWGKKR